MAVKKGGLGRGLDALFDENSIDSGSAVQLRINEIEPNRNQPRKDFDEEALNELAESIKKHGIIQPIAVRPLTNGVYQIIAGERRWRAARLAGLETVPVTVMEIDDKEYAELSLIENLQREDLNPVEEAQGYKNLMVNFSLTQETVAETVGKSRSAVANALRLLSLEVKELNALKEGKITAGHARALLSAEGEIRKEMFKAALSGASVRELEKAARQSLNLKPKKEKPKKSNFYKEVELALRKELGKKVNIKPTSNGKGTITLEFFSDDELTEIAKKLAGETNENN